MTGNRNQHYCSLGEFCCGYYVVQLQHKTVIALNLQIALLKLTWASQRPVPSSDSVLTTSGMQNIATELVGLCNIYVYFIQGRIFAFSRERLIVQQSHNII